MIVALEQYRPLGTSVVRKLGICIFEIAVSFFIDFTVLFQLTFAVHQCPCALKSIQHSYPQYEYGRFLPCQLGCFEDRRPCGMVCFLLDRQRLSKV